MSVKGKKFTTVITDMNHEEDLVEKQARLTVQTHVEQPCEENLSNVNDKVKDIPKKESKTNKTVRTEMSNGISKHKKDHGKEVVILDNGISQSNKNEHVIEQQRRIKNSESSDVKQYLENEKADVINSKTKPINKSTNIPKEKGCRKSKGTATKKKLRAVHDQEIPVKKQTSLTDHFQVRRSERRLKTIEVDEAKIALQKIILSGIEDGLEIKVIEEKGRGIFSSKKFSKGDFICEYAGELIDAQEARAREEEYEKTPEVGSYMYFFEHKSKKYCVDATKESNRLGRLLNHSKISSNVCTKLFPINDTPYLILVASQNIEPGEELLYDYGDRSKKSLDSHPWLNC